MKAIALSLAVFCVLLSSAAQLVMKRGMAAGAGLVLGITWLGEPFSWTRLAGCGLIVAGVWLLALDA